MKATIAVLSLLFATTLFADLWSIGFFGGNEKLMLDRDELNTAVLQYLHGKGYRTNAATLDWGKDVLFVTVVDTNTYSSLRDAWGKSWVTELTTNSPANGKTPVR